MRPGREDDGGEANLEDEQQEAHCADEEHRGQITKTWLRGEGGTDESSRAGLRGRGTMTRRGEKEEDESTGSGRPELGPGSRCERRVTNSHDWDEES